MTAAEIHQQIIAIRQANKTGNPVCLPPEPNGVVVVVSPGGRMNNLATQESADNFIKEQMTRKSNPI